jgi:hypothetical protein
MVATVIPQSGVDSALSIESYRTIPVISAIIRLFRFDAVFSSILFICVIALLLLNTLVCTWHRVRIAQHRRNTLAQLSSGDVTSVVGTALNHRTEGRHVEDSGSPNALNCDIVEDVLRSLGFTRLRGGKNMMLGSTSSWALYASPIFHILLVALLSIVLIGRFTRLEAVMVAPLNQSRMISVENVVVDVIGRYYRFQTPSDSIIALDMTDNLILDGQSRGIAADLVVKTAQGQVSASQITYVNHPLAAGSKLIHVVDIGYGLRFSFLNADGSIDFSRTDFTSLTGFEGHVSGDTAHEVFKRFNIATGNPAAPNVLFHLMPNIVDEEMVPGRKEDAFGQVWLADNDMNPLFPTETLSIGEAFDLRDGRSLRFDGISDAVLVRIVDDWSVPYLYLLAMLSTLALAVALLSCPRFCAVWVDERSNEIYYLARFYRPHALDAEQVGAHLHKALSTGEFDEHGGVHVKEATRDSGEERSV